MTRVHFAACNQCRWLARYPDGAEGEARARAAAYRHAADNRHAVARYEAVLVELVEACADGVAYQVEVAAPTVGR